MRNIETFDTFFNLSSNCTVHNLSDPCVLGDILILQVGDVVPADCRILDSTEFSVDNSGITGESEPIELDPTATHEKQLFSKNMAFTSACVVRGTAKAVVTRTVSTVKLGNKELFDKKLISNKEPFPVTNLPFTS